MIDGCRGLRRMDTDQIDHVPVFELSAGPNGRSLMMLRNGNHAVLMYLQHKGDAGVVTKGCQDRPGSCSYTLSNGQVDDLPLSWCIDVERGYEAIAYFFVNDGMRYDHVEWQEA